MSYAEVKKVNNTLSIVVDGKVIPPMAMTMFLMDKPDYLKSIGDSGIKMYYVLANTDWMRPGRDYVDENGKQCHEPSGYEAFEIEMKKLLASVPDAYVMVRIAMHPPVEWVESHPDDVVTYSDGSTKEANFWSEIHTEHFEGHYSMASENWRRDASKALHNFCDKLDKSEFAEHIIGFFFAAGGTSEWYYMHSLTDLDTKQVGDFSPAFRREYTEFLKEKYVTEENLRKAWKDPTASFENPKIPPFEDRSFFKSVEVLFDNAGIWDILKDTTNKDEPSRCGVILNANDYLYVADFYSAWHKASAKSVVHFAREIKNRYNGSKLTGAFYGALGCTNYLDTGTCSGTLKVLDSGYVDFLAAPGTYNNRQPGGYVAQREMRDSFTLRNMIYICEEDSRTHRYGGFSGEEEASDLYTLRDSIVTLKRDFARNICDQTHAWWFDQAPHTNRYEDPGLYDLFAKQQKIAELAYEHGIGKSNEIAVIVNCESMNYVSMYTSRYILDFYRTTDLGRIGASCDFYFDADMDNDKMSDYKVYIMLNGFALSDKEREKIKKKAAKNGAMIIWLYAAGLINPDAKNVMSTENMKNIVGMNIKMIEGVSFAKFRVLEPLPEAIKYADIDRQYGHIDRRIKNMETYSEAPVYPYCDPMFYVDDPEATVLGRYSIDGKTALAMKKDESGIINVYCGTMMLRSELLASLAEYAGCHIYGYDDDYICASDDFVMIHAKKRGKHTIYFKKPCNPFEVYEKKYYGKDVTSIEVEMRKGDTLTFSINDKISEELKK